MIREERERWNAKWSDWTPGEERWPLAEAAADWMPAGGLFLAAACGPRPALGLPPSGGVRVVALDLSEIALERAREAGGGRAQVRRVQGDACRLPFGAARFDAVLVRRFHAAGLLPEVRRVLKPGGLFLLEAFAEGAERDGRPVRAEWCLARRAVIEGFAGFRTLLSGYDARWVFFAGLRDADP